MLSEYCFAFVAEHWFKERKKELKETTIAAYYHVIQGRLTKYFNYASEVNEQNIQNYIFYLFDEGLKKNTVKGIMIVLKMISYFGYKNYQWKLFNWEDFKYPKETDYKKIKILKIKDQKKMFNYLTKNLNLKNIGLLIVLQTGLRIGEICGLKWEDINLKNGFMEIQRTVQRITNLDRKKENFSKTKVVIGSVKTKSSYREIPLSNHLSKILKLFQNKTISQNFVLSNDEKPIEPRIYREYYTKIMRSLKIKIINFHSLRHTFATRMIEAKTDYKTVSSLLGHSNIKITLDLYVHPNLTEKKKGIEQMNRLFI